MDAKLIIENDKVKGGRLNVTPIEWLIIHDAVKRFSRSAHDMDKATAKQILYAMEKHETEQVVNGKGCVSCESRGRCHNALGSWKCNNYEM